MSARTLGRRTIASVALGSALLVLGGATAARADDYGKCQDKLEDAREKLNRDISHHGPYSRQARNDQNRLYEAQNWCNSHHVYIGGNRNDRNARDQDAYRNYDRDGNYDRSR